MARRAHTTAGGLTTHRGNRQGRSHTAVRLRVAAVAAVAALAAGSLVPSTPAAAAAPAAAAEGDPPSWSLMAPAGRGTQPGIAASADGRRAVAVWWRKVKKTGKWKLMAADLRRGRWSDPQVALEKAPHTRYDGAPLVAMSANSATTVVSWGRDLADEGALQQYALVRDGGEWGDLIDLGVGDGVDVEISDDGSRALLAFSTDYESPSPAQARWWDANGWSAATVLSGPEGALGEPEVAISADGGTALAAWVEWPPAVFTPTEVKVRSWDGAAWGSAQTVADLGFSGHLPAAVRGWVQVALAADGAAAAVAFTGEHYDSATTTTTTSLGTVAGGGGTWGAVVNRGVVDRSYRPAWLSPDGTEGRLSSGSWLAPTQPYLWSWTAGALTPMDSTAGADYAQFAITRDASRSALAWEGEDAHFLMAAEATDWDEPWPTGRCGPWTAAAASEGKVFAAGECDGSITVAQSPADVTVPQGVRVKVKKTSAKRGKARIRWQRDPIAQGYRVSLTRRGTSGSWRDTERPRFTKKVRLGKRYVVRVRAVGPTGPGPTAKVRFRP